jgi:hypothetical protein
MDRCVKIRTGGSWFSYVDIEAGCRQGILSCDAAIAALADLDGAF